MAQETNWVPCFELCDCNIVGRGHKFASIGRFDGVDFAGVLYAQISTFRESGAVGSKIVIGEQPRGSYTVTFGDRIAVIASFDSVFFTRTRRRRRNCWGRWPVAVRRETTWNIGGNCLSYCDQDNVDVVRGYPATPQLEVLDS